jgi:signal peptidase
MTDLREDPWVRRGASALATLVVVAAVAMVVVNVFPAAIGADASYVVQSGSMEPAIGAGDIVVVRSTDAASIEVGDVITYTGGTLASGDSGRITHRVVEVRQTDAGRRFVTKGDANENRDPEPVAPSQVVGTVWFSVPYAGYLVAFASSDLGIFALVVVPGALLVVTELRSLYRDALVEPDSAGEDETPSEDAGGTGEEGEP